MSVLNGRGGVVGFTASLINADTVLIGNGIGCFVCFWSVPPSFRTFGLSSSLSLTSCGRAGRNATDGSSLGLMANETGANDENFDGII